MVVRDDKIVNNDLCSWWYGLNIFSLFYLDDLFNYDVIFPNKNGTANVTVSMGTTMTSFTLCLWIQTTDPGPFHIFSYLSQTGSKDLSLTCENKQYCKLLLLREYRFGNVLRLQASRYCFTSSCQF